MEEKDLEIKEGVITLTPPIQGDEKRKGAEADGDDIQELPEASATYLEDASPAATGDLKKPEISFTAEEADRVYRKLDWNLMPLIFVLYSLSVLDRANLGNARIAGMEKDIDLSGNRYPWLATIFYIACEFGFLPY
jgi:hypothetical protein